MTDEFEGRPELVKKRARTYMAQRLFAGIIGLFIIVSMTLLVVNAIEATKTRAALVDCTTPAGQCYQEGQKRTAKVVEQLYQQGLDRENITREIIVIAAGCAADPENTTIESIEDCVNERLDKESQIDLNQDKEN